MSCPPLNLDIEGVDDPPRHVLLDHIRKDRELHDLEGNINVGAKSNCFSFPVAIGYVPAFYIGARQSGISVSPEKRWRWPAVIRKRPEIEGPAR